MSADVDVRNHTLNLFVICGKDIIDDDGGGPFKRQEPADVVFIVFARADEIHVFVFC